MPRILSISYDEALLKTRALMLAEAGFEVESAIGFTAAIQACKSGDFDLVIMGHSIPYEDKQAIAKQLQEICATPILSLLRPYETSLPLAEYNIESGAPDIFLEYVKTITSKK